MSKKLLITCRPTNPKVKNIGDYIQTIAVKQYSKKWEGYIEREETNNYKTDDGEIVKVVFNGCYIREYNNWPPSSSIHPLFTSVHIFPFVADKLLTPKNVEYFKAHGPIGCRDLGTLHCLEKKGIPAYFSACLTLTLGETFHHVGGGKILFVDPVLPDLKNERRINLLWCVLKTMLTSLPMVAKLYRNKYFHGYSEWGHRETNSFFDKLRTLLYVCKFIEVYTSRFECSAIKNAQFISNMYRYPSVKSNDNDFFMQVAEDYLKEYSKASLVVTSRIHAALPSIAMNTPTVFVVNDLLNSSETAFNTPGRFDGIIDFFRSYTIENNRLETNDDVLCNIKKIGNKTIILNKDNWKPYAEKLKKIVLDFVRDESI